MKIKRVVLSRIGPFLFLAALLLYPFTFTAAIAQEMPDVIGVRMTDGSVIDQLTVDASGPLSFIDAGGHLWVTIGSASKLLRF